MHRVDTQCQYTGFSVESNNEIPWLFRTIFIANSRPIFGKSFLSSCFKDIFCNQLNGNNNIVASNIAWQFSFLHNFTSLKESVALTAFTSILSNQQTCENFWGNEGLHIISILSAQLSLKRPYMLHSSTIAHLPTNPGSLMSHSGILNVKCANHRNRDQIKKLWITGSWMKNHNVIIIGHWRM